MSLLLAIALATSAQAADPPATLTLREARSLSPRDLTRRVLGLVGTRYPEVHLLDTSGGMFADGGISAIQFATTPSSAGFAGLCVAETILVSFHPTRFEELRHDRPRRVYRLDTGLAFRIVGDTNDRQEMTDAADRALDAQCARAGPVLTGTPVRRFFGGDRLTGAKAHLAARMLQKVIAEARQGVPEQVSCAENPAAPAARACADPRNILATLPVDRLTYVEVNSCAANPTRLCVKFDFEQERTGNSFKALHLTLEADVGSADPPPESFRILSAAIRHATWVED